MAGVCDLIAVLSGGQWLVCLVDCCSVRGQWLVCGLVAVLSKGQSFECVSWLLFCQEANGWRVLVAAVLSGGRV